jgi:hypothetical protein
MAAWTYELDRLEARPVRGEQGTVYAPYTVSNKVENGSIGECPGAVGAAEFLELSGSAMDRYQGR